MLPLNYAILKFYTTCDKASAEDVMAALDATYHKFQAFTPAKVNEALMTAEKNGLITEVSFDLNPKGELRVFYSADEDQKASINTYIK